MTLERIGELEELPVDLNDTEFDNAIQKAHNLKEADEINTAVDNQSDLEDMILANTSMQSYATADVLYDFDGFALTAEDGTRELKNKALHSDTPNGKLYSGNPLDFQGSQRIEIDKSKIPYSFYTSPFTIIIKGKFDNEGTQSLFWGGTSDTAIHLGNDNIFIDSYDGFTHGICSAMFDFENNSEIAFVYDGTDMVAFVDGIEVERIAYTAPKAVNQNIFLGSRNTINFLDGQMEYFAIIDDAISESEIKRFTTEPEKALTDYGTNPDLKGVFVTDFSGDSEFISNMCESESSENLFLEFDGVERSGGGTGEFSFSENSANITSNADGGNADYPRIKITLSEDIALEDIFEVSCTITSNSEYFSAKLKMGSSGTPTPLTLGTNTILLKATSLGNRATLSFNGEEIFDIDIVINYIKKVQGIHQIQGYQETQRTNFQSQATGYQHLLVDRNELGFTNGLANGLNFDGKSYVDTQAVPNNKDFTYEFLFDYKKDGVRQQWGSYSSDTLSRFGINKHTNNGLYFYIGEIYTPIDSSSMEEGAILVNLSIKNGFFNVYINGIPKLENMPTKTTNHSTSFILGGWGNGIYENECFQKFYYHRFLNFSTSKDEAKTLFKLRQKQFPTLNLGA